MLKLCQRCFTMKKIRGKKIICKRCEEELENLTKIKTIESKSVKDRTKEEHFFLIKNKYNGSIRDYLISMGEDFKDFEI